MFLIKKKQNVSEDDVMTKILTAAAESELLLEDPLPDENVEVNDVLSTLYNVIAWPLTYVSVPSLTPVNELSKNTLPDVGCSSRLIHRTKVDFPAPENPMIPKISPCPISKFISFIAWVVTPLDVNILFTCSNLITLFHLLTILS